MLDRSAPRAPRSRPTRFSEFGWGRKAFLAAAALVGSVAFAAGASVMGRQALWQVVRACVLDKTTTGSALPCLSVEIGDGEARGYAVLRPPIGRPDTILTPTRRILGIEDAELQAPGLPNYFALAWEARHFAPGGDGAASEKRMALAVNSRLARSQDQLHVHIGCLAKDFAAQFEKVDGPMRVWRRAPNLEPGLQLWTYRSGDGDWSDLNPFQLAHALLPDPQSLARTTLAAAKVKGEFVLIALSSEPHGWYAAAEDVIDARCE